MKRLDDQTDESYVKACVYGKSGTGKTSFGCTAPKPLILLSERQGMTHVRQAAKRLGVAVPQVLFMQSANDYRNVTRALQGDKAKPFRVYESHKKQDSEEREKILVHEGEWPESVVIDSMTDASRLVVEEIRLQSPPKRGNDGLPVDSQRFWQVLPARIQNLIFGFRDLPIHVVFLALAEDRESGEDDNKVRSVTPSMPMRKLPEMLTSAVNVVGYTYRKAVQKVGKKEKELQYGIMTVGPEYMVVKPYRPLRDVEVPDFTYWIKVIRGEIEAPREAPEPSQELAGGDVSAQDKPAQADADDASDPGDVSEPTQPAAEAAPAAESEPAPAAKVQRNRRKVAG